MASMILGLYQLVIANCGVEHFDAMSLREEIDLLCLHALVGFCFFSRGRIG